MNRHKTGEADGMNLEVDSKDEVMQTVVDIRQLQCRVLYNVHFVTRCFSSSGWQFGLVVTHWSRPV